MSKYNPYGNGEISSIKGTSTFTLTELQNKRLLNDIKEYLPGIDPENKSFSYAEILDIIKTVGTKKAEKEAKIRYAEIQEKGITVGCFVENEEGERYKVSNISVSKGALYFKDRPGAFYPKNWKKISSESTFTLP